MNKVIDSMLAAVNVHDLDALAALFDEGYDSRQPAHPGRAFVGGEQVRVNWEAMFDGIPDFRAEVSRTICDGETSWVEWSWSGIRTDDRPFEMRGVAVFDVRDGLIVAGTLYMEDVEGDAVDAAAGDADAPQIEQIVEKLSGRRPRDD